MRTIPVAMAAILGICLAGCGNRVAPKIVNQPGRPSLPTAEEAGNTSYRYAFSAQVTDAATGEPVPDFSVAVSGTQGTTTIINPLGETNGVFHLSRTDGEATTVPLVITAPGYEPVIQPVAVTADCSGSSCVGARPAAIELTPRAVETTPATLTPASALASTEPAPKGTGLLRRLASLKQSGKISGAFAAVLAPAMSAATTSAASPASLSKLLVLLKPKASDPTGQTTTGVLGSVKNEKLGKLVQLMTTVGMTALPLIASTNPEIGAALSAVKVLLPYFQPMLSGLGQGKAGGMGQLIAGLLAAAPATGTPSLGTGSGSQWASLLLPMMQGLTGGKPGNPLEFVLANLLKPAGQTSTQPQTQLPSQLAGILPYLQPLIQGLAGQNGTQLSMLFNQLVGTQGILGVRDLAKSPDASQTFAALLPFLEPLTRGLNSENAQSIAASLTPLLQSSNPASAVRSLLTRAGSGERPSVATMLSALFPAAQSLTSGAIPNKQLFAAQLLQGLLGSSLTNVKILEDMKSLPGVVISASPSDVLKIAALPDVEKITPVP